MCPPAFLVSRRPRAGPGFVEHLCTVDITPGSAGDEATATIITDRQGFIELARGLAGERVRVEGDKNALVRLQQLFSLA